LYNKSYSNNAFLIDATGFVLKYWFSIPPVKTRNFESISAFLGFSNFVLKFLSNYQPRYITFAFDESLGTCFRNDYYCDYKKNRELAPDELKMQLNLCRQFLDLIGLNNNASKVYEADDILNTMAINARKLKLNNIILTNDKDLFQMVYKDDIWWNYKDKKYSYEDLKEKLNFSPHNLSDFLGLMGDSVDNIPGAPGLGEKTAMVLMGKYKSLENIFLNINDIPSSLGQKYKRFIKIINDNKKIIYLSKKLATLVYIEEIDKNISIFKRKTVNIDKLDSFLINTGMKAGQKDSWLKEIRKYGEIL
jgi:5'-3' exonuclease